MEIRVLRYFLKVCELGNISKAAQALLTSQPNLSRQLSQLENELGHSLFIRGKRQLTLTEEGLYLQKQAENIVNMIDHTENQLKCFQDTLLGQVYIGAAESVVMSLIGRVLQESRELYPGITYHLNSGGKQDVTANLDNGLADFAIVVDDFDDQKYQAIKLTPADTWGILMRKDDSLADKKSFSPQDLHRLPLATSGESLAKKGLQKWLDGNQPTITSTFNLITNTVLMIAANGGRALVFDGLAFPSSQNQLIFRPLEPILQSDTYLIWKKHQPLSKAAQKFLFLLKQEMEK